MAEPEIKYTAEGVPIVSMGTLNAVGHDIASCGIDTKRFQERIDSWLGIIDKENPIVSNYIRLCTNSHNDSGTKFKVVDELAGLYMLIRRQSEANKLEEKLGF